MQKSLIPGPRKTRWDEQVGQVYRWKTAKGEVLLLEEMTTRHIFCAMKMLFNHIALNFEEARLVWFRKHHPTFLRECKAKPYTYCEQVFFLIGEIERRGDLDPKYWDPYYQILAQIKPLALRGGFFLEAAPAAQHEQKDTPSLIEDGTRTGPRLLPSPAFDSE